MDPQLWEEIAIGDANGEIDAIIRLKKNTRPPEQIRIVSQFGDIATCRMLRRDILAVRQHPSVRSLKASRRLNNDVEESEYSAEIDRPKRSVRRRPRIRETGAGVIIGVIDYGCDFAHHAFRHRDGRTRIRHLWDQRSHSDKTRRPDPYRRGRVFTQGDINAALGDDDPYNQLDYDFNESSHGSHVLDIAAGNGRGRGVRGLAPEAEIIFVHVASGDTGGSLNFGDSVGVLEAIDYINRMAGDQPTVINISMGMHGGPHDGSTLVERAFDNLLKSRSGLSLVQSCGNYYGKRIHCAGQLTTDSRAQMAWQIPRGDNRKKELEIWYPGQDRISVNIQSPDGDVDIALPRDSRRDLIIDGDIIGRAYHRIGDPGNGDTHVDIFLYGDAPHGDWKIELRGDNINDGNWHSWIERVGRPRTQSRFSKGPVSDAVTCGTIAHGRGAIQVAAHKGVHSRSSKPEFASFSSAGPSRDGRSVPLIAAPGYRIWAAKSADQNKESDHRGVRSASGTSMASPHVTGLVALMLQAAPKASQRQIRHLLKLSAHQMETPRRGREIRANWGQLNEIGAVRAARGLAARSEGLDPVFEQNTYENSTAAISPLEWGIIKDWVSKRMVPTNGAGGLPANMTSRFIAPLPFTPPEAARAIAQALLNYRTVAPGARNVAPLPNQSFRSHPTLDPLARAVLPAIPPTTSEWAALGAFMETQNAASQPAGSSVVLFGDNDVVNRQNMAHYLACARFQRFSGGGTHPVYCAIPQQSTSDPAIRILMETLTIAGPLVDWSTISLDRRRVHVMHKLITKYGYSRNAAAGIVGNLDAESGVNPTRVEGSAATTPRRATSLTRLPRKKANRGARRQYSALQIMNRLASPLLGPYFPGIGLAQWTYKPRRLGFYAHKFKGIQPSQFMIYFMDHQIDYLVFEMQRDYRRLERRLRAANVTQDGASDDFVYLFERPGKLFKPDPNRPKKKLLRARDDAQVQEVFEHRRTKAARAARAYARVFPPQAAPDSIFEKAL